MASRDYRSQWGQDRFIAENILDFRDGTFLEVGALDGAFLSNTWFFEKGLGWSGILVEMQPHFFPAIERSRPNSRCFNCALGDRPESLLYFDAGDRSSLLRYIDHASVRQIESHYRSIEPKPNFAIRWVDVRPLMDVAAEAGVSHIDYFSLDVEGAERVILESIDLDRLTVDLFTIEDNARQWAAHRSWLEPRGYAFLGAIEADGFFLHRRLAERLRGLRGELYLHDLERRLASWGRR
jgi:FkbM family methyltransferase